jgi:hypothetical protein
MSPPDNKKDVYFKIFEYEKESNLFWGVSTLGDDVMITLPDKRAKFHEKEVKKILDGGNKTYWLIKKSNIKWAKVDGFDYIEVPFYHINKTSMKDTREEEAIGWKGEKLNSFQFHERTESMCAECFGDLDFQKRKDIVWLSAKEAVCKDCSTLPIVEEALKAIKQENSNG